MAKSTLSPEERAAKKRAAKSEYDRLRYLAIREQKLAYQRQYVEENKDKVREYKREWKLRTKIERRPYTNEWRKKNYHENLEKSRAKGLADAKRWRAANLEKARAYNREQSKRWAKANLGIRAAQAAARRLLKSRQMPPWADVRELYAIFENCPPGLHVDYVVPLRGITIDGYRVSGLHVPWNLQYLAPFENVSKNNRMRLEDHAACGTPID